MLPDQEAELDRGVQSSLSNYLHTMLTKKAEETLFVSLQTTAFSVNNSSVTSSFQILNRVFLLVS